MKGLTVLKSALAGGASIVALAHPVVAKQFNIPGGDLSAALFAYMTQSNSEIFYVDDVVRGHRSRGAKGDYTETAALTQILRGTGFTAQATSANAIQIVPAPSEPTPDVAEEVRIAAAAPRAPAEKGVETVVVTAQKKAEDIQQVPIAVTALSQQQLTERQIAGGPDLIKEVPNLTFSKTNFTGYNIEIRGIGTQAVSVTTDPAVAVAFNGTPFIRNHFFEQEFYDLQDVEVLRGPQGTLYGRNATAGVVNVKSALPTDQYEALGSIDVGNYNGRRMEGMINLPIVGDKLDIRFAGEWTKRDGYTFDTTTNSPVDGRDLWSGRLTIGWKPMAHLQTYLVWEHFSEDDDRLRSGKVLCKTDPGPSVVNGPAGPQIPSAANATAPWLNQGCLPGSLYSPSAYGVPNPLGIPFVQAVEYINSTVATGFNPYGTLSQSPSLREISSSLLPHYMAKNDTLEFNAIYTISPSLTLTSQTGYNKDFLYSTEDFNRFATVPNAFQPHEGRVGTDGQFCDPQLGCSTQFLAEDLSLEHAEQFYQEVRLTSDDSGPLNFNVGANYTYYQTVEDYYVFSNFLTIFQQEFNGTPRVPVGVHAPFDPMVANFCNPLPATPNFNFSYYTLFGLGCAYIDPNPLSQINGRGHNYYRSQNPYVLNSFAGFGEAYYQVTPDLKLTGGLRFTDDMKHFTEIPSWTLLAGEGYPVTGVLNQQWQEVTGRFNATWTPDLGFTDQSLFYASYSRGYKGGGANPPGVMPLTFDGYQIESPSVYTHQLTFKPEFINAYELGTKNSLLGNTLTLNADVFYYKYWDYQISSIVDRTAINQNFNATVHGAELEGNWEPLPGLRFNFAGGYEDSAIAKGTQAIDLIDRTAGTPGWMVVRPYITQTSSCILPTAVVNESVAQGSTQTACLYAYGLGLDPITSAPYVPNPDSVNLPGYAGFNPATAPNLGEGFMKNLSGNKLPNMPPFTLSLGSQYTLPVSADWAATLRADFYWQGNSEARVFNDKPYDSIHGYSTMNLSLILDNDDGWQAMFYVKNVFDVTAITGDFLNGDDTGLSTNVFLTDPRLFGVRVTKKFDGGAAQDSDRGWVDNHIDDWFTDALDTLTDKDGGRPPLWIELGGQYESLDEGQQGYAPPFLALTPGSLPSPLAAQPLPGGSFGWSSKLSFQPDGSDWVFSASVRYGRSGGTGDMQNSVVPTTPRAGLFAFVRTVSYEQEVHTILDFMVGRDVGLGMFGGTSVLSGGVRVAQFESGQTTHITDGFRYPGKPGFTFTGAAQAKHGFHGIGPAIDWEAAAPLLGDTENGELTLDWGANAAVLFGRRSAAISHQTSECSQPITSSCNAVYAKAGTINRARRATVPDLGGFAGLSFKYRDAKISFGYRADEFFGAMDGGYGSSKTYSLGFFGPYANISIGVGG